MEKSLYELTKTYPELIDILKELGFLEVINPVLRNTIGRKITIPQGCEKQGINLSEIISRLEENGFSVKS